MFTGLITDLGRVRGVERRGDTRFTFETHYDTGGSGSAPRLRAPGRA